MGWSCGCSSQEAVAGEGPLGSERMTGLQEIPLLAPPIITQAREIEHSTTARTDKLEVVLQGSAKTREIRQGLAATALSGILCVNSCFATTLIFKRM